MQRKRSFHVLFLLMTIILHYPSIAFHSWPRRFQVIPSVGRSALFSSNAALEKSNPCSNYVLVHRNKQSMAFRNGSPLIFSGSIHSTISFNNTTLHPTSIPVGTLVGVMVMGKEHKDHPTLSKRSRRQEDHVRHFLISSSNTVQEWDHNATDPTWKTSKVPMEWLKQTLDQGALIGFGVWNPFSMYRVRMLCHQSSHPTLFRQITSVNTRVGAIELILTTKIRQAMSVRQALQLPSVDNDCYRFINGEGDGLSGLVVDVFPNVAVIMASALWCEIYKETIIHTLQQILNQEHTIYQQSDKNLHFIWRNTPSRLIQDGLDQVQELLVPSTHEDASGDDSEGIVVTENGVRYYTYPWDVTSQKTGFYCDQRENRMDFAKFCHGKRVLDLCCFNGGFALNAVILGNATHAIGIDSSPVAIEAATKNAQLNGLGSEKIQFLKEDVTQFMKEAVSQGREFDTIVLDPPKLAPSQGDLERATRKYHTLNRDAMKLVDKSKGGILMTCTCSAAMTQRDGGQYFLQMIKEASLAAGRQITLLKTSGAAQCHTQCPASYPAGVYLTAAWIHVHPVG